MLSSFDAELKEAPNLRSLRAALSSLIGAAQELEGQVVAALPERKPETD